MKNIGRQISLLLRKWDSAKDRRRVLRKFTAWRASQDKLPPPASRRNTLLLIRLDDIGDYLLFRNQLAMYKKSARWRDHRITLLGNESWRELFNLLDSGAVDDTIWAHKNRYLEDAQYRLGIWIQLRDKGFETVITPSCTRPLLLDDLCMLAAAPLRRIGSVNTNVHAIWNWLSDSWYTSLFNPSLALMHEFQFNAEFAEWVCGIRYAGSRPRIERLLSPPLGGSYIGSYVICFAGASTRSKRWPVKRWIEFVTLHRQNSTTKILFAGNSRSELEMVHIIQRRTGTESIAGTVTLPELLHWVAGAQAVVTNDTMAAHMGVSFNKPTVIIANGVNYMRFAEYGTAGIDNVATVYPDVVNRRRARLGDGLYAYSETVTADIASIQGTTVVKALKALLERQTTGHA
jgi:ADP-heptose:LPS heptosyltransferase